ncbi:uncharacterized protein LACBIDRAFT_326552 [Laccaria bicolor S238N-H82]|uniref:Predicted protein n=1 Tax=Laccaria bicolor (strain S238N-H82 / ATCC MYA-4686) TaxID=486041 RepID=B0D902_LACBS|nr:uncharacterized protein LACBIDRAFT_326552 [Laccaria bicolor S238N-H82]EDR08926.1 predicted protein [Laccaria bicolor S238N-H82]|eukprot:XP_001880239.1 predicted protein [Laccaria bicolor S238N-H82]
MLQTFLTTFRWANSLFKLRVQERSWRCNKCVWNQYEDEKAGSPEEQYIRTVTTLANKAHVIVTLNSCLASFVLSARWIMVDTTFKAVHGTTNEFKVVIWVNSLDKLMSCCQSGLDECACNYWETTEFQDIFEAFTTSSTDKNLQNWWAHKLSYPWLLPSLSHHLSLMKHAHWDLAPSNTNPIEGSHANDNQIRGMNHSLLEAILLAKAVDSEEARILQASQSSGILENPHNSLEKRFTSQAARKAKACANKAESSKAAALCAKIQELENELKDLSPSPRKSQLTTSAKQHTYGSQPRRAALTPVQKCLSRPYSLDGFPQPDSDDDFANLSIPIRRSLFDIAAENLKAHDDLPLSDFDYDEAMRSDVMDAIFEVLTKDSQPVEVDSTGHTFTCDLVESCVMSPRNLIIPSTVWTFKLFPPLFEPALRLDNGLYPMLCCVHQIFVFASGTYSPGTEVHPLLSHYTPRSANSLPAGQCFGFRWLNGEKRRWLGVGDSMGDGVFKGSVQSGFLPRKRATVDRNRSRTDPDIEGTEPNHLGPVFCGP